jgi:DNA repair protein RecN (Recombination protein N)
MLKKLMVKNIAIIEDIQIEFQEGMTVLSGETGAGKSLIIDSISLLLGARADSDLIRYGENKAYIEGIFDYKNPKINELLTSYGIEIRENITIYRELSLNGRNIIKVNDTTINNQLLKNISLFLADIHVQHDTFRLINPDTYLSFIDNYDDESFLNAFNLYQLNLSKYKTALSEFRELENKHNISKERLEYLTFEAEELEALNLAKDKDLELEERISKLSNYDKIYKSLNEAYQNMESEYFSLDNIYNAYKALDDIKEYDKEYLENTNVIFDAYSNLLEAKSFIYKALDSLDYDEEELNTLEEELKEINDVKKKYNKTLDELIKELEDIKLEISLNNDYDNVIKEKKKELEVLYNKTYDSAISLRDLRKKNALDIEKNIEDECHDLDLSDTKFKVAFNEVEKGDYLNSLIFNDNGIDTVDFMISLNKGEPLKPLNKTASGGELSRIMLAFKSYFSRRANLSLMVFDEIDTGVSGNAAHEIALKMKNIAKTSQVLCITHIPAVAAMGDNQILIKKEFKNDRTTTSIKVLKPDERILEIAKMMGGSQLSSYFIEASRKMLEEK